MANTALTRTPGSAGNRRTWTWSAWIKKSKIAHSSAGTLFGAKDGSYPEILYFASDDTLVWQHDIVGSDYLVTVTDRKFRDTNAWYHIVLAKDTTQSTEADRIKIYVNGEQQTLTESQLGIPGQNYEGAINNNVTHTIGNWESNSYYFDGSMSHIHFIDGTAYAASTFGSTDASTGEWKINTTPNVTYGSNGFFILKDGNSVTDQSGNSNNFTVASGTLSKTEDSPSNVFATLNPLAIFQGNSGPVLENANTTLNTTAANSNKALFLSSLGMTQGSGKFYCEIKIPTVERFSAGVCNKNVFLSSSSPASQTNQAAITYYYDGTINYDNSGSVSGGVSLSNNDILGIALDMDNNRLFFHKNGTYINSGDPTSSTGNVASFTNASQYLTNHEEMFFFVADTSTSGTAKSQVNFGNGYFGTTAVSSAGTNASNIGIFEYDVPTGYTALCTKGLNE